MGRSVLLEAGAIRECEEHGWMRDRSDPHARERALLVARQDPPPGVSPDEAAGYLLGVPVRGMSTLSEVGGRKRMDAPAALGIGGRLRTYRFSTRKRAMMAAWFVVML